VPVSVCTYVGHGTILRQVRIRSMECTHDGIKHSTPVVPVPLWGKREETVSLNWSSVGLLHRVVDRKTPKNE
jgi:hypothetical protein